MNNFNERYYIEICKTKIEQVLNIGESNSWKQRDYDYLCEQVFHKTRISISLSTIKRIWNNDFKSTPQPATLNALAAFLDFEDWNSFKKTICPSQENKLHVIGSIVKRRSYSKPFIFSIIAITIAIGVFSIVFISLHNKIRKDNISQVKFSLRTTDTTFPNSVVFYYDVASISPEKLTIQQSWDPRMTIEANSKDHYRTCIYYYPGFYKAKLIANDKTILKETPLVLYTSDWLPMVLTKLFDSIPKYIRKTDFTKKKEVYISPAEIAENGIHTDRDFYVLYSFCKDFHKFSSDSFIFETKLKNNLDDGALLCQTSAVYLSCENGWINIPLTNKGCVSDIKVFCSEQFFDGKNNDLSGFGCNMNQWHTLKLENINRKLSISLDGKKIFNVTYKSNLGDIYEIGHFFKGCGRFKDVSLKKLNKKEIFTYPY